MFCKISHPELNLVYSVKRKRIIKIKRNNFDMMIEIKKSLNLRSTLHQTEIICPGDKVANATRF